MKRRQFLKNLSYGLAGVTATAVLPAQTRMQRPQLHALATGNKRASQVIGSAKNVIFVFLEGGASHVDTFDLKLGRETPSWLGSRDYGYMLWPDGTMPLLGKLRSKFAVVRSLTAVEAVHERAVYHLTTGYRQDVSRAPEIPHLLSAVSYELEAQRKATDTLPTSLLFGYTLAENGFFPVEHRGLKLGTDGSLDYLTHESYDGSNRFNLLDRMREQSTHNDARSVHTAFQSQARRMMQDTELQALFGINDDTIFGPRAEFRSQCETAVRLLDANKGTRAIQMQISGWDHHFDIYQNGQNGIRGLSSALDGGLSYLINSLDTLPAKEGNGTLLDETLIVVAGEFGRTTGGLNESFGRDHYPYAMSALFAGGGVQGGRAIGSTTDDGSYIIDRGWSQNRQMGIGDLLATIYAALGIDYAKRYTDTPSGRLFELVPAANGPVYPIDALFA